MVSIIMCLDDQAIALGEPAAGRPAAGARTPRAYERAAVVDAVRGPDRRDLSDVCRATQPARVFNCCKHADAYAQDIARKLAAALGHTQVVFYDRGGAAGQAWAAQIDGELRDSDVVLALLTTQSIGSELVEAELRQACKPAALGADGPRIVVVRLRTVETLPYPIRRHVARAAHVEYSGSIGELAENIRQALDAGARPETWARPAADEAVAAAPARAQLPRPLPWADPAPRAVDAEVDASLYVERDAERALASAIERRGVTIAIKGPRQSGKTLLLSRLAARAAAVGKRVVSLDFQFFEPRARDDAAGFFQDFLVAVAAQVGMEMPTGMPWGKLPNNAICTSYFERELLPRLGQPLALAIDCVDRIADPSLRSDFFLMLRAWHNRRATSRAFRELDLVLATATDPAQLTADAFGSPFNVAIGDALADFTPAQVGWLNQRHGVLLSAAQAQQLLDRLGGHPFLIRRALYLIVERRWRPEELLALAADDGGPFGDHLRYHLFKLAKQPRLAAAFQQIARGGRCPDEQTYFELHSAGLVLRDGQQAFPRCRIYADYLAKHLA
jgi:hypothetical protein